MKNVRRFVALLLCICMMLSIAACSAPAQKQEQVSAPNQSTQSDKLDRDDKELVAELIGGQDASDMTDEELDKIVNELLGEDQDEDDDSASDIINLGTNKKEEEPTADASEHKDAYDTNGAMTQPFDQVYPELIEQELVAFSGESILIKLESDQLTDGLKAAGVGALEVIVPMEGASWYEAKLVEGTDVKAALKAARELDETLLAEYNYEIEVAALDARKEFGDRHKEGFDKNEHHDDQWHMHHCGIPDAFEQMETDGGDPGVIVAVIDSGVDYDHEDLKDNMWVNSGEIPDNGVDDDNNGYVDDYYGVDIVAGYGNGDDTNGHGTHVAGIIAAQNNNLGVVGIAYNVKIMSVKAAMHNGTLNQADIAKAVLYAYEMGAEVINMSFGGTSCSIAVQDALATAYTRCVLVASAGNSGAYNEGLLAIPNYPAALTYVLGVMSVDETGRESIFTNWDVFAFNGVEYELYAPGENIMSTLPGNKYGFLSGTSMAAPVVSAFAAILRSEFTDRDKYPTKFIYGQLSSTSGYCADCLNPDLHGLHNLPQIANLYDALTKLPKPEVNMQEYYLFDDPALSEKNNGDGVIDAGETIALGLVIRNRWGMSENTLVTLDTISSISGMADPYINIVNPTVDYGSVGTYSTQDAGKIFTDELFTGWEDPFIIEIADNCPNDYRFTLNVTITCENALDEADEATYISTGIVNEYVRSGYILPTVIDEDMVLTPDNLYIIPNATIIKEGVTVRVEPGTHIQFWSDDADDPYADNYIAYLVVNGQFLVEGTKENPVYIYPSQLMDRYGVEISATDQGYVSLKYADITNFFYGENHTGTGNRINLADHCTFRSNYGDYYNYRYLSDGVVEENYWVTWGDIGNINAKDCVFYKMGFENSLQLYGQFDRCIFVQCGIHYSLYNYDQNQYRNCVFLGNSLVDQTRPDNYMNSSMYVEVNNSKDWQMDLDTYYWAETGTTYVRIYHTQFEEIKDIVKEAWGADYAVIETEEELKWLANNLEFEWYDGREYPNENYDLGIAYNEEAKCYTWHNGEKLPKFLSLKNIPEGHTGYVGLGGSTLWHRYSSKYVLLEIPGYVLPTEITFNEYAIAIDMEATYQLNPMNQPTQLPLEAFIYTSTNEEVVTVSETGLITPVGIGTADVYVYSQDKAVYNYVTVEVKEYVALEEMYFPWEHNSVAVGETLNAGCTFLPIDTTRKNAVYTSSDESIAKVDAAGNIIGVSTGTVTITATCEGLTVTTTVDVYIKAKTLGFDMPSVTALLSSGSTALPTISTNTGAKLNLVWYSTDTEVAEVKDGKLVLNGLGTTTLQVTDLVSGLSDTCIIMVLEEAQPSVKEIAVLNYESYHYALMDNGDLYFWYNTEPYLVTTGVQDFAASYYNSQVMVLKEDGLLEVYCCDYNNAWINYTFNWFVGKEIAGIAHSYTGSNYYFAYTTDGNAYAWGDASEYGQLGVGTTAAVAEPKLVMVENVVDIVTYGNNTTYFLTASGEVYYAGGSSQTSVPTLAAEGIAQLYQQTAETNYIEALSCDNRLVRINVTGDESYYSVDVSEFDSVVIPDSGYNVGIKDGKVYYFSDYSDEMHQVDRVSNAKIVYAVNNTLYIVTADGILLGYNIYESNYNHIPGADKDAVKKLIPIWLGCEASGNISMTENNLIVNEELAEGFVLQENVLVLKLNKVIDSAYSELYIDGTQIVVRTDIRGLNEIWIYRSSGFEAGTTYEMVIPAGSLSNDVGDTNEQEIRIPFTYIPVEEITGGGEGSGDETTDEPIVEEPVIHESVMDESLRTLPTAASVMKQMEDYILNHAYNHRFHGNAILNPISTDFTVSHWLRLQASSVSVGSYSEIMLGGNWWGSVSDRAIGLQLIDYTDFPNYAFFKYDPFLTEAPENTFPFVTSVKLINKYGEEVTTVGNEEITFRVTFNRDMDTSIPLLVRFGSAYPYGDYEVAGEYVDARTWEGVYTLNTLIENGNQYFTISNGCSATDDLPLQLDQYRFGFVIDTTAAQALIMQGTATDTGIQLNWTQDDFDTLMGYNVYRSTSEDGYYQRLNATVIPADTMEWFDDTVEPGVVYYYNFTVVQTDLTESEPSGKIVIMSKDTMAPNIYHSPINSAFTGANLVITATVTDNLNIAYTNMYYRVAGTDTWNIVRMNSLNDKYSAIIPAANVTVAGIEYYFEAFDGVSYTYKGSADAPYTVTVQEAIDANSLGDVDGNGTIDNLDALLLLYAINDKYNLTAEEFARADLNGDGQLWAAEALRILQYASGVVGSVKM